MSQVHEGLLNAAQISANQQIETSTNSQPDHPTLQRLARIAAATILASGGFVAGNAKPAEASATFVNTYPNGDAADYNVANGDWWVDENGNGIANVTATEGDDDEVLSPRLYSYRNCTDGVAYWTYQYTGVNPQGWGDAKDWDSSAGNNQSYNVKGGNSNSIEPGDIAQSEDGGGGHGHVGFVIGVTKNANGVVTAIETAEYNKGNAGEYSTNPYSVRNGAGNFNRGGGHDWDHYIDVNGPNKGLANEDLSAPEAPPPDTDNDGLIDPQDHCPTVPGIPALYGCRPNDIDGDGKADLAIVNTYNTGTGKVEVHPLAGSGDYVNWLGHHPTVAGYIDATQQTLMGDITGDGKPDLLIVNTTNTGSGKLEVHPLSGAGGQTAYEGDWVQHYVTPANYLSATDRLALADVNYDGKDDLLIINTANTTSGKVEIHPLNAADGFHSFINHWVTPANYLDNTYQIRTGDSDGDGKAEVFIVQTINTGSGKVEVHRLDPATNFATWAGHDVVTPVNAGSLRSDQMLVTGDVDADGKDDLVIVNTNGALNGSGKVEVHPLSGITHFSQFINHYVVTPLTYLEPGRQRVVMGGEA